MKLSPRSFIGFCIALTIISAPLQAQSLDKTFPNIALVVLPALDLPKIANEDAESAGKSERYRYAVTQIMQGEQAKTLSLVGGSWSTHKDGALVWRVQITAVAAKTIDLQLEPFRLPHSAKLTVSSEPQFANGRWQPAVVLSFSDQHNNEAESLPTAALMGETVTLELTLDANDREFVRLGVKSVNQGYRGFEWTPDGAVPKAGGCNVDVICPQGNAYRDQIRSVARYSAGGGLCTGTLLNTTAQNRAAIFLTARHCLDSQSEANTVVAYYNYQSSACRALSGGEINSPSPSGLPTQNGAELLASAGRSDFTLLRLNGSVPAAAAAYWAGWDRRDAAPASAVAIHHPSGDEKRISLENDPVTISSSTFNVGSILLAPGTGLRVANWDVGTTEQGSSGSALFAQDTKRVVGTLSGGSALCSGTTNNGQPDTYGRLFTGWEGEGAATSRLRDHLDPNSTSAQTLDGLNVTASCTAPQVDLTVTGALEAGTDTTYRAQISLGIAPYKVEWEIDSDALVDRTAVPSSTGLATLNVRYNKRFSRNISVKVTDAANCATTITRAVDIRAPLLVADVASTTAQVCGDGDATVEPGERWRLNTGVRNTGTVATLGAAAQFSQSSVGQTLSAPDAFGYRHSDSARGQCALNYVDISTAPVLAIQPSSAQFPALDDGRTSPLSIGTPIEVYGELVSTVMMSTNGYIVLNPGAGLSGGDIQSNCGLTPARDGTGKRLQVLHADLQAGELRAGSFATCPRPSDVANANTSCVVLEWRNMAVLNGSLVSGSFDMQAILYPGAREIVYQYRRTIPDVGINGAVTGLLNTGVGNLNYACPTTAGGRRVSNDSAVCFFHPQSQPAAAVGDAFTFAKSTADLGAILAGGSTSASAEFFVNPTASCGSSANINLLPGVDARSVSEAGRSYPIQIGAVGNCQVSSSCPAPAPSEFRFGSFYNEVRGGNGLVAFTIPRTGQAPYFLGTWFTGEANRNPTWYSIEGDLIGDQVRAPIVKLTRNVNAATFTVVRETVGQAQVSVTGRQNMVMSYQFNNGTAGGDKLVHLLAANAAANPDLTGHYFRPGEGGWGQTYESFVGSAPSMFILNYIYDSAGQPRWTLAQEPDSNLGNLNTLSYQTHCPSCAWMDINPTVLNAGTQKRNLKRDLQGKGVGIIDTNFILPAPLNGTWLRTNLDVQSITPLNPTPAN